MAFANVAQGKPMPQVQVAVQMLEVAATQYDACKAEMKSKMNGRARRTSFPIHIFRLLKEEEGTGHLLGDGRLPNLRAKPPKSMQDFRELLAKLIFVTCTGIDPPDWCPHQAPAIINRSFKYAKLPVWWPDDVEFKDPAKMKGAAARRGLKEAVVRCYHLFNELEMLSRDLREVAAEFVPRVAPGELPLSPKMTQSFYALYMHGSVHGIDE